MIKFELSWNEKNNNTIMNYNYFQRYSLIELSNAKEYWFNNFSTLKIFMHVRKILCYNYDVKLRLI